VHGLKRIRHSKKKKTGFQSRHYNIRMTLFCRWNDVISVTICNWRLLYVSR